MSTKEPRDAGVKSLEPSDLLPSTNIKDLHSLDLVSATSSDNNSATAQGENEEKLSSPGGFDAPGQPHPCSSGSTRDVIDVEILPHEMIKNLDTGEEIPLIQAVENLPSGIHPLTLHIMKRTKEYSSNVAHLSDDDNESQTGTDGSNLKQQLKKTVVKSVKGAKHLAEKCGDKVITMVKGVRSDAVQSQRHSQQQQSEDDDDGKVESPVTDMNRGKLKQKTTQMQMFIGRSVKKVRQLSDTYGEKAINKMKSFRSVATQSTPEEPEYRAESPQEQDQGDQNNQEEQDEQEHTDDDDDHKVVDPPTDTDGEKIKQKTTVRNFIGKSVEKARHLTGEAINKVKLFHNDATQSTHEEPKQYQDQEVLEDPAQDREDGEQQSGDDVHDDVPDDDPDHQVESPLTDTDGSKHKQKTTVRMLIGKSVEMAKHLTAKYGELTINKMKSFRDVPAQSLEQEVETEQEEQQSDDTSTVGSVKGIKHLAEEYELKSVKTAQSGDDEEQEQRRLDDADETMAPVTDRDGGINKPKSTHLKTFMERSVTGAKHLAERYGEKSAANAAQLKELLGRSAKGAKQLAEKAASKVKSVHEVFHPDQDDEDKPYVGPAKFKASHNFEGPFKFDQIKVVQDLSGEHMGAVWAMKFSLCGRLLATAGDDNVVRIWVLKTAFDHFNNMRTKNITEGCSSTSPSQKSSSLSKSDSEIGACTPEDSDMEDRNSPFCQTPFCEYKGHTSTILDLSWSKDHLLLSSSLDKTVRLWHISRRDCQWSFPHKDMVTGIAFHPKQQSLFLSGCMDRKLRLWSIIDKKVELWNEVSQKSACITAANFCETGKYAIVGTLDGRCILYDTENLKYHSQFNLSKKVTGIEPLVGENKILVTSSSRIHLYDLRDMRELMRYKGYANKSLRRIKASFNHDYSLIVNGSEDKYVYIWSTCHNSKTVRWDRNDFWERIKAHNAVVTSAIFAPHPGLIVQQNAESKSTYSEDSEAAPGALKTAEVLVSADVTGAIKVLVNVKGRDGGSVKKDTGLQGH